MTQNKKTDEVLPEVVESAIVFDRFFKIRNDRLRLAGRPDYNYLTLVTPKAAVVILARTLEGTFVLNYEYRHPIKGWLLGCPGGFIETDELPEKAAPRELLEETGYTAENFFVMGSAFPYPGISLQKTYFVCAENAKKVAEATLEPSEVINTVLYEPKLLRQYIKEGKDIDSSLLTALYLNEYQ